MSIIRPADATAFVPPRPRLDQTGPYTNAPADNSPAGTFTITRDHHAPSSFLGVPWAEDADLPPSATQGPIHDLLMRAMWGDGYDATSGRVDMSRFAEWLRTETDRFGSDLVIRLCRAGIDTSRSINLDVAGDSSITARGEHPQRAAIEKAFADDEMLPIGYRKITSSHHLLASSRLGQRYTLAWNDCKDDEEREAVWRHYVSMFEKLSRLAGQTILRGGILTSAANSFAASFPLG